MEFMNASTNYSERYISSYTKIHRLKEDLDRKTNENQ